jgi:hypothetical protein
MSIPMVFSIFLFFYFFSTGQHLTELKAGVGAKSQSSKNEGKITIRLHSRGKITNLPMIYIPN